MIKVPYPKEGEYPPYFADYYKVVGDANPSDLLVSQLDDASALWYGIPEDKGLHAYAEGKWTIKQLIGHVTDTERIMSMRAMCITRGEEANLPSFEENDYARLGRHNERTLGGIIDEWKALRQSNIILFSTFNHADMERVGMANNYKVSVAAIIYAIVAHEMHHTNVLKERYDI